MSVNEVKLKKAVEPFVVRGSGPPTSRTYCIGDEDHTIGNSLRHVLISNQAVGFAGYSVPHPAEPIVQIRIQTIPNMNVTATDALQQACQTLNEQCYYILETLEELTPEVRLDRIRMENLLLTEEDDEMDNLDDMEEYDHNNNNENHDHNK